MSAAPRSVAGSGGLLAALGLFSVLPVPERARTPGAGVLRWLPVVGLVLGGLASLPGLAVWRGGAEGSPLLAAALVVVALALLTRGLHLDATADLADGLGSGRPAEQALAIMRRPEVGAFAVAAIACTVLVQVAALAAVLGGATRGEGVLAVVLATVTGRVAVLHAAARRPAAGSSLGVLVAGAGSAAVRVVATAVLVVAVAAAVPAAGGSAAETAWSVAAVAVALTATGLLTRHADRRLGGVNGDVFGALVEVGTTVALVVLAAGEAWT
ncbi:adenosylcobinamide-GDP ribazoletransferase [Blastococcus sp. SYSU DS1021]